MAHRQTLDELVTKGLATMRIDPKTGAKIYELTPMGKRIAEHVKAAKLEPEEPEE